MVIRDLIGIPYKPHGRDLNGLDCYGLVIIAIDILTGIKIPDIEYSDTCIKSNFATSAKLFEKVVYEKLEKPQKNCIIVFDKGTHCGVYLGHGEFIHSNASGVNIAQLHGWECRISGVYKVSNNQHI